MSDTERPMSPSPAVRTSRRQRWPRVLAVAVLLISAGLALLAWLASGQWGVDQAVARLEHLTEGRLRIDGARGSLLGPLHLSRVTWRQPDGLSVVAEDADIDWRPAALLAPGNRIVHLTRLRAADLRLRLVATDGPARLPDTLALPWAIRVDRVELDRLHLMSTAAAAGAARQAPIEQAPIEQAPIEQAPIELTTIVVLGLDYRPGRSDDAAGAAGGYRIERLAAASRWGALVGEARLTDRKPYPLQAAIDLRTVRDGALPEAQIDATLGGDLGAIALDVRAAAGGATLAAHSTLTPFAARPLGRIRFSIRDLDPRRFDPRAPEARLDIDGHAEPSDGDGGPGTTPPPRLVGELQASNSLPGRIDESRLPLRALSAQVDWVSDSLSIRRLAVRGVDQASVAGQIRLSLAGVTDAPEPEPLGARAARWLRRVESSLRVERLDLADLRKDLVATSLAGTLTTGAGEVTLALRDAGALLAGGTVVDAKLRPAGHGVVIEQFAVSARGAKLTASGGVGNQQADAFELRGSATNFDTRRWWQPVVDGSALAGWQAVFDGDWRVAGRTGRHPSVRVEASLAGSRLNGRPANGRIAATIDLPGERAVAGSPPFERISDALVDLTVGGSRLAAQGAFGRLGDQLTIELRAPALADWDRRLAGRAMLAGELAGTLEAPAVRGQVALDGFAYRSANPVVIASLRADVKDFAPSAGRIAFELEAAGIELAGTRIELLHAQADGDVASHAIRVAGQGAGHQLRAAGQGAIERRDGGLAAWRLALNTLELDGPLRARIQSPAALTVRADGAYTVEGLDAAFADGRVRIDTGSGGRGPLAARGAIDQISVDQLLESIERLRPGTIDPDLRRGNDLRVRARFDLAGAGVDDLGGEIEFDARSQKAAGRSNAKLTLRAGSIAGPVRLELTTLAWARGLVGNEWRVDGAVIFDGQLAGTLRSPRLTGDLRGERLLLEQQVMGWRFRDGVLAARFDGQSLRLERLRLFSGTGYLDLGGVLRLPDAFALDGRTDSAASASAGAPRRATRIDLGQGDLALRADRLPLTIGPGQRVVLSGDTRIAIAGDLVRWSGRLAADEGLIELKDLDTLNLPPDVEVVNTRDAAKQAAQTDSRAAFGPRARSGSVAPIRFETDLEIDPGERFKVIGAGVDARLTGSIRLAGRLPEAPRASGTLRVRDGSYTAYGQRLEIRRGRLVFNGPLDNPALDIVAVRRYLPVEAGVALSGTAQFPIVRLVSTPDVPDAEKLSWLVLGVGLEDAGSGSQALALQAAAASLFGDANGGGGGLSRMFGLDTIGIRGASSTGSPSALPDAFSDRARTGFLGTSQGGVTGASGGATQQNVVALGKRISSKLFVSYEQGIRGVWNLLRIQYDISNRLSVRAFTGSESAVDLLYMLSFD